MGKELFKYAQALGKKVYITSDMYLEQETVEKILEKNGWRQNEEDSTHWEHPDVVFNIKSYGSEEHPLQVSVSGQIVPLVYVHQLQQILRFCGYIEMALSINVGESDVKNIEFSVPYKES